VGIVGCGEVTRLWHLPALARARGLEVVAVTDTDAEAAARAARTAGLDRSYSDIAEFMQVAGVDVVAVCVPTLNHVEVAIASFEAGRHVLLEKPPALDLHEYDRLLEVARSAGSRSLLGTNMRHLPGVRRVREEIQSGRLGQVLAVQTLLTSDRSPDRRHSPWRGQRKTGGGALVEKAVHHIDLWRHLLGSEVEEIATRSSHEDFEVLLSATMEDSTQVSTLASDRAPQANQVTVVGRDASLALEVDRPHGLAARLRSRGAGGDYMASMVAEWCELARGIHGGYDPEPSLESGRALLQTLLAAAASASTGVAVRRADAPARLVA